MSQSPAFQFYPADFLSDENVALMSLAGRGAYITLICYCWREGSIPSDMNRLGRLCGIDSLAMAELWAELDGCFELANGRYIHPRLERERVKQQEFNRERQESGRKGAEARWQKTKNAEEVETKQVTEVQPNAADDSRAIAQPLAEPIANDGSSVFSLQSSSSEKEKKTTSRETSRSVRRPTACDEEFLEELQRNPAYSMFDVKVIYHRMVAWCSVKGKDPTRRRFINWLNREDKPMTARIVPVGGGTPTNGAGDDWSKRQIAKTVEDLPSPYKGIALNSSTEEQKANVLAGYNRRVREARGEVTA